MTAVLGTQLTVAIVNWRSARYIRFLERTLRRLAASPDFRLLICNNGDEPDAVADLARLPYATVFASDAGRLVGSDAHGAALNEVVERLETEYAVIVDPDCAMLAPNWDRICIHELDDRCIAIGAPYDRRARSRYQDFPAMFFFFFRVAPFRSMRIDLRPDVTSLRARLRHRVGLAFGREPAWRDVGWRMPEAFRRHGFTGKSFDYFHGGDSRTVVVTPETHGDEFHWRGHPVLTHQGRSGQRPFWNHPLSRRWIERVCQYLGWNVDQIVSDLMTSHD